MTSSRAALLAAIGAVAAGLLAYRSGPFRHDAVRPLSPGKEVGAGAEAGAKAPGVSQAAEPVAWAASLARRRPADMPPQPP